MRKFTVMLFFGLVATGCGIGGSGGGNGGSSSGAEDSFQVDSVTPADQAQLANFPSEIRVTFNSSPSASSITTSSASIRQSGGDGDFSNGNETSISWNSVSVSGSTARFDFSGTNLNDDSYRITLRGNGNDVIASSTDKVLDGNNSGNAGGNFTSDFTVMAGAPSSTTFSAIQTEVFNLSCALSGCHTGANPTGGMNLSAGMAYTNIVGVASSEVPALQRVSPGNADDSYLVQKLEGTAAVGARMPFGAAPLSDMKIQNVRDWIDAGALEN